jgi:acyl-CoA thioesterase-1
VEECSLQALKELFATVSRMNILCFGSSSTYGAGDPESGWVSRLRKLYDAEVAENTVNKTLIYNLGISGETTTELRRRFEREYIERHDSRTETIVVFAIGGNDAAYIPSKSIFKVAPDLFESNIVHLLKTTQQLGARTFVQSLTPVNDAITIHQPGHDRSKSNQYASHYTSRLATICNRLNAPYIDAWSAFMNSNHTSLLCSDGVHPNAQGHQIICDLAKQALQT